MIPPDRWYAAISELHSCRSFTEKVIAPDILARLDENCAGARHAGRAGSWQPLELPAVARFA